MLTRPASAIIIAVTPYAGANLWPLFRLKAPQAASSCSLEKFSTVTYFVGVFSTLCHTVVTRHTLFGMLACLSAKRCLKNLQLKLVASRRFSSGLRAAYATWAVGEGAGRGPPTSQGMQTDRYTGVKEHVGCACPARAVGLPCARGA